MYSVVTRAIDTVVNALTWVAGGVCMLMALHVSADLIGRQVFNYPVPGTNEIATNYYMVALSFLPLAVITRQRGHIMVGLFTDWLPEKTRLGIDLLADFVTLGFAGIVAWMGIDIAVEKTVTREMTQAAFGYLPIWEARWILAVCFSLMCVYAVLNLIKDLRALYPQSEKAAQ